jgi:hypothetical protein
MRQLRVLVLALAVVGVTAYGVFRPPQWLRPAPPPCGSAASGGESRCLSVSAANSLYDNSLVDDGCPQPIFHWTGEFVTKPASLVLS